MGTTMQERIAAAIENTVGEHVSVPDSLRVTVGDIRVSAISTQTYRGMQHRTNVLAQRYTVDGSPVSGPSPFPARRYAQPPKLSGRRVQRFTHSPPPGTCSKRTAGLSTHCGNPPKALSHT